MESEQNVSEPCLKDAKMLEYLNTLTNIKDGLEVSQCGVCGLLQDSRMEARPFGGDQIFQRQSEC